MTLAARRQHFMDAVGEHLPRNVLFHGTSSENAESIARNGFSLDHEAHGRSAGEGVYLHRDPLVAAQHGQSVIAVKLAGGTKVANKTDTAEAEWRATTDRSGGSHEERTRKRLADWDFHGHTDTDDGSVIVHDPARVQYVKHFPKPEGFGEREYLASYDK